MLRTLLSADLGVTYVRTAIERPQQQTGWIEDDDAAALLCICIGLSVCLTLFVGQARTYVCDRIHGTLPLRSGGTCLRTCAQKMHLLQIEVDDTAGMYIRT